MIKKTNVIFLRENGQSWPADNEVERPTYI